MSSYAKVSGLLHLLNSIRISHDGKVPAAITQNVARAKGPFVVSYLNTHAFNIAWQQEEFLSCLRSADVLLRDGVGVKLLLWLFGKRAGKNMCGSDTIPMLLESYDVPKVALLGAEKHYVRKAAAALSGKSDVVCWADGFKEPECYLSLLKKSDADIVILGMGMPKQELLSELLREQMPSKQMLVINGGAIIDLWGGKFRRAPKWVRRFSLEWLFRTLQEPKRLFGRFVIGNIVFLFRIISMRFAVLFGQQGE